MITLIMLGIAILHIWITALAVGSLYINIPIRSILSVSFVAITVVSAAIVITLIRYVFGNIEHGGEYSNYKVIFNGFIGWHFPLLVLGMFCHYFLKDYRQISGAISSGFIIASIWWFFYVWSFTRWH